MSPEEACVMAEKIKFNKVPSADAIPTEVFKCSSARPFRILPKLFNVTLRHTHLPKELIKVTLVPILKCSTLSAADIQNYRSIALPS